MSELQEGANADRQRGKSQTVSCFGVTDAAGSHKKNFPKLDEANFVLLL